MINEIYLKRMQNLLKEEYPAYLSSLSQPALQGFRVNPLRTSEKELFSSFPWPHEKSPFSHYGYYTKMPAGIGWTPAYREGLFYMQEPSASAPVTVLNPQQGMKILDLCAAPGSKSTEIAELLGNTGLLCANEYIDSRADILLENMERCGFAGVVVLNADTHTVAEAFPSFFDAVLVDAPCSGEGMFRKSESARQEWSLENVQRCAARQKVILEDAYSALNQGGTLVYSTCTFSLEENEENINSFLERHPDMHIVSPDVSFGRPGIGMNAVRIYPMDGGEGQFMVKMQKDGQPVSVHLPLLKSDPLPPFVKDFLHKMLKKQYPYYYLRQNRLYGGIYPFIRCGSCRIKREQVYLGEIRKNRFEPSHHFFTSAWSDFANSVELDETEVIRYMHGDEIPYMEGKGWLALKDRGHVIGGGKGDGRVIKNKYPKALRSRREE